MVGQNLFDRCLTGMPSAGVFFYKTQSYQHVKNRDLIDWKLINTKLLAPEIIKVGMRMQFIVPFAEPLTIQVNT